MDTANIMEYFCLFDVSFIFFCLRVEKNPRIRMRRNETRSPEKAGTIKPLRLYSHSPSQFQP